LADASLAEGATDLGARPGNSVVRRRILLQPTEVFSVSEESEATTTYVTRMIGSSEMLVSVLEGRIIRRSLGGASDLAPGASGLSLGERDRAAG